MTRLLLTWIGVAALQLGTPSATSAAELLDRAGESTSVMPRTEAPSKGALSRDRLRPDAVQSSHVTPFAPAGVPQAPRALTPGASPTDGPSRPVPASLPHVLPDARAPPA